jgi:multiple sugar transport system permease protein
MARFRRRKLGWSVARSLIGVLIVVWSLAPIYWGIIVSLSTPGGLNSARPSAVPNPLTFTNYSALLHGGTDVSSTFLASLRNSAIEAVGTTAVTVIVAALAAYGFARWKFRGSSTLFIIILGTMALPIYAVLIPLFQFTSHVHQVDTYQAIVLISVSASLPLAVWILRSHMASLPVDIENAARIEGASWATLLWKIVTPLIAPGMAAAAVIVFLTTWASFLIPLTFASTIHTEPLTVILPQYATRYSQEYGLQAAAGIIALLPPAAVVCWLNRHLVRGLLAGSVNQ